MQSEANPYLAVITLILMAIAAYLTFFKIGKK